MKKNYLFILFILASSLSAMYGQTPYDNFAPEQSEKSLLKLQEVTYTIENPDKEDEVKYMELDAENLILYLYTGNNEVIASILLNPNDVKFLSVDPLADKYPWISSYAYCANNPINYMDFRGDSITIVHNKGFLGLGGKETLIYENGNLFNTDGNAYTGKINGYLKSVVGALGSLNTTAEGASLVSELQNSSNMLFTIKNGNNAFVPHSIGKAGANLAETQSVTGNMTGSSGSGGTIYWNSNSTNGGLNLAGNTTRPAYIALGHEMGHASDSNQGLLHFSRDYTNGLTGATYFSTHNGLLKSEWRAVYRENIVRSQAVFH